MKSFTSAAEEVLDEGKDEKPIEFELDGRTMRAYQPTDGQLAFMLAALGRGQTNDQRFASIINIIINCLHSEDADYLESRLLSSGKDRLPVKTIEQIFEFLVEEWFARPTQPQSDSAGTPPTTGPKSKPRTTKSTS